MMVRILGPPNAFYGGFVTDHNYHVNISNKSAAMKIKWLCALVMAMAIMGAVAEQPFYRTKLDYDKMFNAESETTAIILSCENTEKLRKTVLSFLGSNSYPLQKIVIAHCGNIPLNQVLPEGFDAHPGKVVSKMLIGKSSLFEFLKTFVESIDTRFVYLSDSQWVTLRGIGFIEESINILNHCEQQEMNCLQVVQAYPYWRVAARLSPLSWAKTGEGFHEIIGFTTQYERFSISPSLALKETLSKVLQAAGTSPDCKKTVVSEYDLCILKKISQYVQREKFKQLFLNDGDIQPRVSLNKE